MSVRLRLLALGLAVGLLVAGCGGVLDPAGEGADAVADLWWVMFAVTLVPLAIVLGILGLAVAQRRRGHEGGRLTDRRLIFLGGVVLPLVVLAPIVVMTIATSRSVAGDDGDPLEIEVTAHQFWWDLRYPDPGQSQIGDGGFRTANEIHIPVGRPVELKLRSEDVIHSFWVPQLHGKTDLVPGRTNTLRITAQRPGVYRGQCAEFCGLGHAYMRIMVVAHSADDFDEWWEREAGPAGVDPEISVQQEFANSCAPCHTVRGVFEEPAFTGELGPDLTHIAARRQIGANLLPNTREGLGRWIVDPQGVKPGNRMPDVGLEGDALDGVLDFLQELE